jgi:hypothetical protein
MKGTRQEHLDHIHQAMKRHFTFSKVLKGLELRFDIGEQDRPYVYDLVDHVLQTSENAEAKPAEMNKVAKLVATSKPKEVSEYHVGLIIAKLCDDLFRWNHRFPRQVTLDDIRKALASPYLN